MNSNWPMARFPKAPPQYDQAFMNHLMVLIENTLNRARSPGLVEAQRINISQLPTASAGLRAGDLWNDAGTVKVV